jgi:hypothetical protein
MNRRPAYPTASIGAEREPHEVGRRQKYMTRAVTIATLTTALVFAAGCTDDVPDTSGTDPVRPVPSTLPSATTPTTIWNPELPSGPFGSSRLAFFGDCDALLAYMQAEAGARVTAWGLGGGPWYGRAWGGEMAADGDDTGGAPTAAPDAAPQYSTTNTQEVGVDEGDIVETDGRYVYTAANETLRIVEVSGARLVASPELPAGSHQMILDGNRLLVATQSWTTGEDTAVSVFDVSDPTSPQLLRRSHLEGRLVASRAADGTVRLVLSNSLAARLPFVRPETFGLDERGALERNRQIIAESTVQDWLPRLFDEAGDGTFGPMQPALDCTTVAAPRDFSGLGVSWIASIDLDGEAAPVGSAGIVSNGETVYASPTSLYVATVPWDWYHPVDDQRQQPDDAPPTMIHAFSLGDGTDAAYLASGDVPGVLLNQFAMSEHEGVLRVASTTEDWNTGASESAVYALRRSGDTLERISEVTGLGKGERIYAVRFLGPTGYVVTFRQIDPLYVLDLSNPEAPVLQGELKIPGYSAYLHPVGDGLLLGVGQDATDEGRALGTQLSLFDVSDPTSPQRVATLPIGGWSEVEWDHKAFLYWPADGTIVLPVSPGWGDCGPQVDCLAASIQGAGGGVVVARLVGRELVGVGTISHDVTNDWGCWNPLQRSVVIGDELVTVGLDQMKFSDRTDLSERSAVRWGTPDEYGCGWYWEG